MATQVRQFEVAAKATGALSSSRPVGGGTEPAKVPGALKGQQVPWLTPIRAGTDVPCHFPKVVATRPLDAMSPKLRSGRCARWACQGGRRRALCPAAGLAWCTVGALVVWAQVLRAHAVPGGGCCGKPPGRDLLNRTLGCDIKWGEPRGL